MSSARREFCGQCWYGAFALLCCCFAADSNASDSVASDTELAADLPPHHAILSQSASERATAGIGNKIVTLGDRTHVVWQDSTAQGYRAIARTLDRRTGQWSPPVTLGPGVDNHARPCLTVDGHGYLHVVIGGHNTPLQYLRSKMPNDSSSWTSIQSFGRGTYPALICGADDVLVLSVRPLGSGKGRTGVDLYVRRPEERAWRHRPLVLERDPRHSGYAGYNTSISWGPEGRRLHLACDVYEGHGVYENRGTNQAVVYMVSDDLGQSWRRSDGSPIDGRPYPRNLDVIVLNSRKREQKMPKPILRIGGLAVDDAGAPFVLYTQHEPHPGRAHFVTPDDRGGWKQLPLHEALSRAFPDYGALGARGALSLTGDGRIQMLLPIAPLKDFGVPGAPKINAEAVRHVFVESDDKGKTFRFREPIPSDRPGTRYVPTLEKPTGHHIIARQRDAAFMYIEGLHRYPKKGEVIRNQLYYVEIK